MREPTRAHLLEMAYAALKWAGSVSAEAVRRELLDLTRHTGSGAIDGRDGR